VAEQSEKIADFIENNEFALWRLNMERAEEQRTVALGYCLSVKLNAETRSVKEILDHYAF